MEVARADGIPCETTPLHYPFSWRHLPINLARAARCFRRHRPQIILGYTSVPNFYGAVLWKHVGARLFVWGQRDHGLYAPPQILNRLALRRTPVFVANAPSVRDFLIQTFQVNPSRVHWVPNAVEIPAAKSSGKPHAAGQVIQVANGHPPKDHETLLRAWCEVQRHYRDAETAPRLTLVGSFDRNPAYKARLSDLIESQPQLKASVHFTGASQDVLPLLQASDIGVLSSRSEGMPNAVLEYMAAGLPVVATDLPGIRDALGNDAAPWLTPVADPQSLATRLLTLLGNTSLRHHLGQANRARAETLFSVEALFHNMRTLIEPP
jgi:glycosyltransferase involved in cell wall biosynthesis